MDFSARQVGWEWELKFEQLLNYCSYLDIWCFSVLYKMGWKDPHSFTLCPPPKWISCLFKVQDWQPRRPRISTWAGQTVACVGGLERVCGKWAQTTFEGERGSCLRTFLSFALQFRVLFWVLGWGIWGCIDHACSAWVAVLSSHNNVWRKKRVGLKLWQGPMLTLNSWGNFFGFCLLYSFCWGIVNIDELCVWFHPS